MNYAINRGFKLLQQSDNEGMNRKKRTKGESVYAFFVSCVVVVLFCSVFFFVIC